MLLRVLDVGFHAGNLGMEGRDAGVKLVQRHGVEILFGKGDQRVVRLAREQIVQIHGQSV